MYICVDFDGTIVDHRYPLIGEPVPGAIQWMKAFQERGVKLILWTMRCDDGIYNTTLTEAVEYLQGQGVPLFGINGNPHQEWSNSPKAYGHVYIDDAAIGCPLIQPEGFSRPCVDWSKVAPIVLSMIAEKS